MGIAEFIGGLIPRMYVARIERDIRHIEADTRRLEAEIERLKSLRK